MPPLMAKGLCIIYVASRDNDSPIELRVCPSDSLDTAIRMARAKVSEFAFAGVASGRTPAGFIIENAQGDELHRWYNNGAF